MKRAYSNSGMAYSWFVICSLKYQPFPEIWAEKSGQLRRGFLYEKRESLVWLWGCICIKRWSWYDREYIVGCGWLLLEVRVTFTISTGWCASETRRMALITFHTSYYRKCQMIVGSLVKSALHTFTCQASRPSLWSICALSLAFGNFGHLKSELYLPNSN